MQKHCLDASVLFVPRNFIKVTLDYGNIYHLSDYVIYLTELFYGYLISLLSVNFIAVNYKALNV